MTNGNDILARQLRALREEKGWRQIDLAARAGIGEATIKRAERGLGAGRASVEALARALGVRPSELTEPQELPQEVEELIAQWVAGERLRPRLDPPVTDDEIKWLRRLSREVWEDLPHTEVTLEALVRAHRSRESSKI